MVSPVPENTASYYRISVLKITSVKNSIEVYRTSLAVSTEGMDGQDFQSLGQY
jgi:hypothetical protein